jgi:hypothetical protein
MRKILVLIILSIATLAIFNSCRKDASHEQYIPPSTDTTKPDLSSKLTASVSGFITDENNNAVSGAQVTGGTQTVSTDQYGYFKISNASLSKTAAFIKVTFSGYFNGYRTFTANEGKETFIRLKLIQKTAIGTINATTGGTATTSDGGSVTLPANAVVNATSNVAYTGTIHVAAHWINPTDSNNLQLNMPGNLLGIDTAGYLKILATYGMLAVELTDDAGNVLQIATGKQATLSFPIPTSLSSSAPATIPLWSFNETNGLWIQESSATKKGNNYVGNVSHFSYWNCDIGYSPVPFKAQLVVDSTLTPLANIEVRVTGSEYNCYNHGYTDTSGFIYGMVPANANLTLNISTDCRNSDYSKNFTTANASVDLGTLAYSNSGAVISGSVLGCNNLPVTNGTVFIQLNDQNLITTIQNGSFSLHTLAVGCTNNSAYIIAVDSNANTQSTSQLITLSAGVNNIGTISTCSLNADQYMIISIDSATPLTPTPTLNGGSYTIYSLADTSTLINYVFTNNAFGNGDNLDIKLGGFNNVGNHPLWHNGQAGTTITIGTSQTTDNSYYQPSPFTTSITEYGNVGEFISGNFTATFHMFNNSAEDHTINCSFRIKRTQ